MAEYGRNKRYQFCDTEACVIIDSVTGKLERLFHHCHAIGTFEDALDIMKNKGYSADRYAIIKLQCVGAFKLEAVDASVNKS